MTTAAVITIVIAVAKEQVSRSLKIWKTVASLTRLSGSPFSGGEVIQNKLDAGHERYNKSTSVIIQI